MGAAERRTAQQTGRRQQQPVKAKCRLRAGHTGNGAQAFFQSAGLLQMESRPQAAKAPPGAPPGAGTECLTMWVYGGGGAEGFCAKRCRKTANEGRGKPAAALVFLFLFFLLTGRRMHHAAGQAERPKASA